MVTSGRQCRASQLAPWGSSGIEGARTGFETQLTVQGTPEYVVAEALDATGTVLGASSAIPVRV